MNLIRNTLLSVLCVQLLAFSYIKIFNKKTESTLNKQDMIVQSQRKVKKSTTRIATINRNIPTIKTTQVSQKVISNKLKSKNIKIYAKKPSYKKESLRKIINTNSKVEKYAKKFLGNKYVWGATGPKTFDCSGFTQKVYRQSTGITIPRVSIEQAKVGKYVKYSELKKGDMVFFDTTKKRVGKVNHVGIYLSNGNFIHASSGGKRVMITNFNKKRFYKNRFLWGRRIIQEHTTIASIKKEKNKEES